MNLNEQKLTDYLAEHSRKKAVSFHMPGHKGNRFFESVGRGALVSRLADFDITEIAGADNLFQPEGVLKRCMESYRELYDVKASRILINGSSSGIIASIMASIGDGEKLILAGNCHKSAISGLTLARGVPVYMKPCIDEASGISREITPEAVKKTVKENPDAKAVLITSPNYYGICSDIKAISEVVHDAGMVLIVDQAHGAHLKFFAKTGKTKPLDAESLGADIVINSTHKTLASFTQTAIINVCTDRVDISLLDDMLQNVQSTSPSYVMMASLDINADILKEQGDALMNEWIDNIMYFRKEAEKIRGLNILDHELLDISKINMDMSKLGLSGSELEDKLLEKGIFLELTCANMAMAMTGIGNTREDYQCLLDALMEISKDASDCMQGAGGETEVKSSGLHSDCAQGAGGVCRSQDSGPAAITSHKGGAQSAASAIPRARKLVHYTQADGLVCASAIVPYPPGVMLIAPGERMELAVLEHAFRLRCDGQKVLGMSSEGFVYVGK